MGPEIGSGSVGMEITWYDRISRDPERPSEKVKTSPRSRFPVGSPRLLSPLRVYLLLMSSIVIIAKYATNDT